jgi:hypothetical protein
MPSQSGASVPGRQNHEQRSLDHFKDIYRKLDPEEIARRTGLSFEAGANGAGDASGGGCFHLRIMGVDCRAAFPEFTLQDVLGNAVQEGWKNILFLRYLCEGKYISPLGKQLSYREIPWGNVYYSNFEGRCLRRFARSFGADIEKYKQAVETSPGLNAEKLDKSDAGYRAAYRFEFLNGLFMNVYLWAGDDEFPSSAQMLFDDNFPSAFTAEDISVVGEAVIEFFKKRMAQ